MDTEAHLVKDRTPGVEEHESTASIGSYTVGLGLAVLATIASFVVAQTNLLWSPGIPVGLIVLALAQIGVHLVFFLHLGSGPDNTNNILALAFGVLVVFLVIGGSVWIITQLSANLMTMPTH
jgi:cytochrome o ubiquinol oxidase subunit IV